MSSPDSASKIALTQAQDLKQKNGFVHIDHGEELKTGLIMRSLTAPLKMFDQDDVASTNVSESVEEESFAAPPGLTRRRRSIVSPFGPFDEGKVMTEGMQKVLTKMEDYEEHVAATQRKAGGRRLSMVEAFFSPKERESESPLSFEIPKVYRTQAERRQAGRADPRYMNEKKYDSTPESLCTCLMVRNIHNKYTQRMLVQDFKRAGFHSTYDFLYVPVDFNSRLNVGYFFINFEEPRFAHQFVRRFHGHKLTAFTTNKSFNIGIANLQGLEANIKKLQDSCIMTNTIPPEYQPMLFDCDTGAELPFPSPVALSLAEVSNRKQDPEAWAEHDEEHPPTWTGGGGLFPHTAAKSYHKASTEKCRPKHHQANDFTRTKDWPVGRQASASGWSTPPATPPHGQQSYAGGWGGGSMQRSPPAYNASYGNDQFSFRGSSPPLAPHSLTPPSGSTRSFRAAPSENQQYSRSTIRSQQSGYQSKSWRQDSHSQPQFASQGSSGIC